MRLWALSALALAAASGEAIDVPGFHIVASERARGAAALLARVAAQERADLAARMGLDYPGTTFVAVGQGPEELAALAAPHGLTPPRWASGVAYAERNTLLFDAQVLSGDAGRALLRHELAHLALGRLALPGAFPRWFQEGFAMLVGGQWSLSGYAATYRASRPAHAIPLDALTDDWPDRLDAVEVAYAQSLSFVSHLYEEGGEPRFRQLIARVAAKVPFAGAFASTYGRSLADAEREWRAALESRYSWVPVATDPRALWAAIALVLVAAFLRARARSRARLAAMEAEEQALDALAERLAAQAPGDPPDPPPGGRQA